MMWIPVNKKTKQAQPPITDAEKSEWLKSEFYASRFSFHLVPGSDKAKAPDPIEAKSIPFVKTGTDGAGLNILDKKE